MSESEPRLWAVVGATGTGKTALSLQLAKLLCEHGRQAEIINGDAMQLYRGMDVGTAKLPVTERQSIPHHLLDVFSPAEDVSVARYQPLAKQLITKLQEQGKDAILVGGSGLYISSVLFSFDFPPTDPQLRKQLEAECERDGTDSLLAKLQKLDPHNYDKIDRNNPRRIIRALEIALLGGSQQVQLPAKPKYNFTNTQIVGMFVPRAQLVERLDSRVMQMWESGILAEAQALMQLPAGLSTTARQAIGYKQAIDQLEGTLTEAEAIAETQSLTRRYARRQVSWFKRYHDITWLGDATEITAKPVTAEQYLTSLSQTLQGKIEQ